LLLCGCLVKRKLLLYFVTTKKIISPDIDQREWRKTTIWFWEWTKRPPRRWSRRRTGEWHSYIIRIRTITPERWNTSRRSGPHTKSSQIGHWGPTTIAVWDAHRRIRGLRAPIQITRVSRPISWKPPT